MLQSIRDHAQGWIAWVIVGLIILTFALFGIDQYAKGDKVVTVAEVNGEDVTAREFLTLYQQQKNRLKNQFGEMYDQVVDDAELREQVMDALLESVVVRQWAQAHNMIVSDQQLSATIQSAEVFHKDGEFDQQTYQNILMRNGLNVARFEQQQRQHLIETQNRQLTMSSALVADSQVNALMTLQAQERDVNYLRIDHRPLMKQVTVTDEDVSDYYRAHSEEFVRPEQVVMSYVTLSQAKIAQSLEVDETELKRFYDNNQDLFTQPEERQASHILIQVNEERSEQEALETIQRLRQQIKDGAEFAQVAEENSEDPGSASAGGDLGLFQQGLMVPEFDKAVFSLAKGELSEPVKTEFGYHLIQVTAIEESQTPAYSTIRDEVESAYRKMQAEQRYYEQLETLNTLAYEQPDTLAPAAEALGLEIVTTDPVSRNGADGPVLGDRKVINTAFSDEVKNQGLNSESIQLDETKAVVLRVNDVMPKAQKPLEEVASTIRQQLTSQKARQASADMASELVRSLRDGQEMSAQMETDVIEYHPVGWMGRDHGQMLPPLVEAIFKAPKPEQNQASYTTFALPTGDSVVIEVLGARTGEMPQAEETRTQLRTALTNLSATAEMQARLSAMVADADIHRKENYKTIKPRL
ncbi:SurA N-terminal domain-containing protein [Thiomicrospira sp. WB1]|uniref:SurA N-terminal domain-containing protein n=1 Tax=Thiomicrospira sp. WB1 TaxID=1685380 RepID=UPI0007477878|nr:SurA N-terminal domain-containing protein [Thiomicrospira sp. WB1]KUJ72150.1 peptidylprolyl isomerase [Thiomicrospira sp. WB1]